jgi:hypothetical protein
MRGPGFSGAGTSLPLLGRVILAQPDRRAVIAQQEKGLSEGSEEGRSGAVATRAACAAGCGTSSWCDRQNP